MNKQESAKILERLKTAFPEAKTMLNFSSVYQLLVAVILSAQCTDKRVNEVTKVLFLKADTPEKMVALSQTELESYIKTCGLFHSKAKSILESSESLINSFNGVVPQDLKSLMSLRGVGKKTANVVLSVGFQKNAFAVDTHVFRVTNRIGMAKAKNALECEKQVCNIIPENMWSKAHHYFIFLGRSICKAAKPTCEKCPIGDLCEKNIIKRSNER